MSFIKNRIVPSGTLLGVSSSTSMKKSSTLSLSSLEHSVGSGVGVCDVLMTSFPGSDIFERVKGKWICFTVSGFLSPGNTLNPLLCKGIRCILPNSKCPRPGKILSNFGRLCCVVDRAGLIPTVNPIDVFKDDVLDDGRLVKCVLAFDTRVKCASLADRFGNCVVMVDVRVKGVSVADVCVKGVFDVDNCTAGVLITEVCIKDVSVDDVCFKGVYVDGAFGNRVSMIGSCGKDVSTDDTFGQILFDERVKCVMGGVGEVGVKTVSGMGLCSIDGLGVKSWSLPISTVASSCIDEVSELERNRSL